MKHTPPSLVRGRPAFTLLELLVTVAIIALLISLVFVAVGKVRQAAGRAKSLNALRNMVHGYISYSTDNNHALMPGYVDASTAKLLRINVKLQGGGFLYRWDDPNAPLGADPFTDSCDASSYVWRLAPYLDHQWKELFTDYADEGLVKRLDLEYRGRCDDDDPDNPAPGGPVYGPGTADLGDGDIGIGICPAFGLNSIYLGGDSRHGGAFVTQRNPWRPDFDNEVLAATRLSEVTNPGNVIVFAPTKQVAADHMPAGDTACRSAYPRSDWGYAELRPPYLYDVNAGPEDPWGETQWELVGVEGSNEVVAAPTNGDFGKGGGLPIVRSGRTEIPAAQLDGSASMLDLTDIAGRPYTASESSLKAEIMSHWWPFSTGFTQRRGGD